jgi:sialidase-1
MIRLFTSLLLFSLCGSLAAADPLFEKTDVFPPGLNGIARYRIPGIVVTPKGTVLAYAEARKNSSSDWGEIEIHHAPLDGRWRRLGRQANPSRISEHGLEGNPTQERRRGKGANGEQSGRHRGSGRREPSSFSTASTTPAAMPCAALTTVSRGVHSRRTSRRHLSRFGKHYDWKVIATGPGHGIQIKSGRLVVPIWLAYGKEGDHGPSAAATIFSDDHGKTWQAGDLCLPNEGDFS